MKTKIAKKILYNKKLILVIIFLIVLHINIFIITKYINVLEKCFNKIYLVKKLDNIFYSIKYIIDNKIIGLISIIIAVIFAFLIYNIYFTRKQLKSEKEGINFKKKDGTHGTANFATPYEIDILKIGDEEETPGIVLGKTLDTDEIITLPDSCKSINRNFMIWGASGSRKIYKLYYSKCFENCRTRKG